MTIVHIILPSCFPFPCRQKVDLTKYIEEHDFNFDNCFDYDANNEKVSNLLISSSSSSSALLGQGQVLLPFFTSIEWPVLPSNLCCWRSTCFDGEGAKEASIGWACWEEPRERRQDAHNHPLSVDSLFLRTSVTESAAPFFNNQKMQNLVLKSKESEKKRELTVNYKLYLLCIYLTTVLFHVFRFTKSACSLWSDAPSKAQTPLVSHTDRLVLARLSRWWALLTVTFLDFTSLPPLT